MKRSGKRTVPFSEAMDRKLAKLVSIYGTNAWNIISRNFTNKSAKQCKERWRFFLNPANEEIPWTKEEDDLLLALENEHGTKWTTISLNFYRRTPGDVRSRFLKLERLQKKSIINNEDITKIVHEGLPSIRTLQSHMSHKPSDHNSQYLIDKIFEPHKEEFAIEFGGILSISDILHTNNNIKS